MASGTKTRAERAVEQVNKRERKAKEILLQRETTKSGLGARMGELREHLEAAKEESEAAVVDKVRAEAPLQYKAVECDLAVSILNRAYDHASRPAK